MEISPLNIISIMISQEDLYRRHCHSSSIYKAPLTRVTQKRSSDNWYVYTTVFNWFRLYSLSLHCTASSGKRYYYYCCCCYCIIPISVLQGENSGVREDKYLFYLPRILNSITLQEIGKAEFSPQLQHFTATVTTRRMFLKWATKRTTYKNICILKSHNVWSIEKGHNL